MLDQIELHNVAIRHGWVLWALGGYGKDCDTAIYTHASRPGDYLYIFQAEGCFSSGDEQPGHWQHDGEEISDRDNPEAVEAECTAKGDGPESLDLYLASLESAKGE